MKTSLSFRLNDKIYLMEVLMQALKRRRQLYPFPLVAEDMPYLQYQPSIANQISTLMQLAPEALDWRSMVDMPVNDDRVQAVINLRHVNKIPVSALKGYALAEPLSEGPYPKLLNWVVAVKNEQSKIDQATNLVSTVIKEATTHQQVHRYIPELYSLLANEAKAYKSFSMKRMQDVCSEIASVGSSRASRLQHLEDITLEARLEVKSYITSTLMLPRAYGIGGDFDLTWIDNK